MQASGRLRVWISHEEERTGQRIQDYHGVKKCLTKKTGYPNTVCIPVTTLPAMPPVSTTTPARPCSSTGSRPARATTIVAGPCRRGDSQCRTSETRAGGVQQELLRRRRHRHHHLQRLRHQHRHRRHHHHQVRLQSECALKLVMIMPIFYTLGGCFDRIRWCWYFRRWCRYSRTIRFYCPRTCGICRG